MPGAKDFKSALNGVTGGVEDKVALEAVARPLETESHGDSLSPLIEPAHETLEEAHDAARALLTVIGQLDEKHKRAMDKLSRKHPVLG